MAPRPEEDARIVACVQEIRDALNRHQCAGLISISTEHRMEFVREIAPIWSCAWIERLPDGQFALRIKSKREDYASPEDQKKEVEATMGMIYGFFHQACDDREAMGNVLMMLKNHFPDTEHVLTKYMREKGAPRV